MPITLELKSSTIEKFIDVVSSAIGKLCAPRLYRKMAIEKGNEIIKLAESIEAAGKIIGNEYELEYKTENLLIKKNENKETSDISLFMDRIENRLNTIEFNRQKNIDKITLLAMLHTTQLAHEIKEEVPENDWLARYFEIAKDISNEYMQYVWSKILANEIYTPGSYSMRSLETLRNLSKNEAVFFQNMMNYRVTVDSRYYIFANASSGYGTDGDKWNIVHLMKDLNLLSGGIFHIGFDFSDEPIVFKYGTKELKATANDTIQLRIFAYPLTAVGSELSQLIDIELQDDYFNELKEFLISNKIQCIEA
jgi:hypothetical protein